MWNDRHDVTLDNANVISNVIANINRDASEKKEETETKRQRENTKLKREGGRKRKKEKHARVLLRRFLNLPMENRVFDLGETNRGWSFSTGYAKSFRRNGAMLLPIRFRPKHSRRNILARSILQMDRSGLFVVMTSKYTNFRWLGSEQRGCWQRQRKKDRKRQARRGAATLLTIFSSINSLSITIQRVCPSVNATIMRWSVSVRLRSPACSSSPSFVSSSIHARAIITVR